MSVDDEINREVGELFKRHFRSDQAPEDIKGLDAVLSDDPAVPRGLGARCFEEGLKAVRAGRHMEGRRLDILGRQLQKRAEKASTR